MRQIKAHIFGAEAVTFLVGFALAGLNVAPYSNIGVCLAGIAACVVVFTN